MLVLLSDHRFTTSATWNAMYAGSGSMAPCQPVTTCQPPHYATCRPNPAVGLKQQNSIGTSKGNQVDTYVFAEGGPAEMLSMHENYHFIGDFDTVGQHLTCWFVLQASCPVAHMFACVG